MNSNAFEERVEKLIDLSVNKHISAFSRFKWPSEISEEVFWFSPDAMSIAGTCLQQELSEKQQIALSKWECINSFSLNNTGERELIQEVSRVMHELPIGEPRMYLHHLIDEENQHMWYFNKFCNMYAGKVYKDKKLKLEKQTLSKPVDHFLVFARVLIFEEIGHYYNIMNSKDERVHPFIREINKAHYSEEARHITFGRRVLEPLIEPIIDDKETMDYVNAELNKSVQMNIAALYNPTMYRDAGLQQPMKIRSQLLQDSARQKVHHNDILKGLDKVFTNLGLSVQTEV